ncbi:carboxymuconolactone decarboxylase family protein [Myroides pelagicus]|uniref:Carboxymuconolactone decarboxylase family protein n=1 Tax=Myroides pelagicus TaxID=270914 RepID=A0A7K1GJY9_9FLAO|nr:carboxymuconolactone decarboxylase family protein [Myroides pelagicus]MEC4114095.1 carboxymuconolactone decarboxylase family protein [Myroides pelagicus]MTH29181.1 carboxymuconolactone decarboxylase family protein [Myroides pelagicus]
MKTRKDIYQIDPSAYTGMIALEKYLQNSLLEPLHIELIKIRASQLNGCGYCLDLHNQDALKLGADPRKLLAIAAWRETELFSAEQRVILQLTEEVTFISEKGITDHTYLEAHALFDELYVAQLVMCAVTINAWNRIAIATHKKAK